VYFLDLFHYGLALPALVISPKMPIFASRKDLIELFSRQAVKVAHLLVATPTLL